MPEVVHVPDPDGPLYVPGAFLLAQAGEVAVRKLVTDAGLTRFRRATETPFNNVYGARR